jgi:hypothetical protein
MCFPHRQQDTNARVVHQTSNYEARLAQTTELLQLTGSMPDSWPSTNQRRMASLVMNLQAIGLLRLEDIACDNTTLHQIRDHVAAATHPQV